jgi:hypothetical protein
VRGTRKNQKAKGKNQKAKVKKRLEASGDMCWERGRLARFQRKPGTWNLKLETRNLDVDP